MQEKSSSLLSSFWSAGARFSAAESCLKYQLAFDDPYGHYLTVKLSLENVAAGQQFALPAWIPGSYMVRDFAKHVVAVTAEADGCACELAMVDKSTWVLDQACQTLTVSLRIYAFDDSVRAAWFDEQRAFVNGTSCFLRVIGREDWPCQLEVVAPSHSALQNWRLATALDVLDAPEWGFGLFQADDYHALVDHPLEAGEFELIGFAVADVPHVMLLSGSYAAVEFNRQRLADDLSRICLQHIQRFEPESQQAPFSRYLFLTYVTPAGYGGLEHRNSTALVCAEKDLPVGAGSAEPDAAYQQFLGLCSHEYFHSWNVKRITPEAFQQPDYQRENYSVQLWAFEGITSYYDDLTVLQADCIKPQDWLSTFAQIISRVYRGSGRLGQSLTESSFTTWTRFYQQDANAPNAIVSYYAKGALAALCLDLKLRLLSAGALTLDDVMRALWQRHGLPLKAVPEDGIENLVLTMLADHSPAAVEEMRAFFDLALRSTADLPLAGLLAEFAVGLDWRAAASATDKGGAAAEEWRVWLGCLWKPVAAELELTRVDNDSPAYRAGLSVKDRLVAINGFRVSADWIQQQCLSAAPGTSWDVALFRGGRLMQKTVYLDAAPKTTAMLSLLQPTETTEAALRNRQGWLQC